MDAEIQNNAAPQPDPVVNDAADTSATNSINPGAPDASNTDQKPTDNNGDANKGLNSQPSMDVFEKRFKDMESKFTRTRQQEIAAQREKAELKNQLTEMAKTIQSLTKKPYSPAEFIKDLQEKGPEAIFPLLEEKMKALKDEQAQKEKSYADRIEVLELRDALNSRRADSENYPDFRKMENTMKEIWESENCPKEIQDPKLSPDVVLDKLYELAKSKHSTDAVKAAHQSGKKEAEKQLAKEAGVAVASGGKAAGSAIPNMDKMSTKQLRDLVASLGGIVDRD